MRELLLNKTAKEKANIKGKEIAKVVKKKKFKKVNGVWK
jgi:predicted transcriptional regulator